ncbi:DUF1206 domain-containing protein [Acaryochloris sp. CCMEE 5410]|uniref:DUF1206 domain-containing protein n=1 Tax=Acaryochloris sp. CCMEE 5410 TaxID=310037 RepID=UPI00031DCEA0|nr:DUF1206 domain-containing protein [Acaryochloris sp. CCMEE 5410]KAI9132300.1 DUF1206 domain-containing protein [Acaryochloris sp. CCMEE 5410]
MRKVRQALQQVVKQPWMKTFMRLGYAAKGILYLFIGLLAGRAALLPHAEAGGSESVLLALVDQPFGWLFLSFFAASLLGYVVRRLLQTILSSGHRLTVQTALKRFGYFLSGSSYLGISYSAFLVAVGAGKSDDTLEDLTAELFDQPLGNWLVGVIGLGVIGLGLSYIYGAITSSYVTELRSSKLDDRVGQWIMRLGQVGTAARGTAFVLIGFFFTEAAVLFRAEPAGGLRNALQRLAAQPYGPLWLGVIGLGLIAYALYMVMSAWYRPLVFARANDFKNL